jgi:lipid-binding SYLF domain-containing protein
VQQSSFGRQCAAISQKEMMMNPNRRAIAYCLLAAMLSVPFGRAAAQGDDRETKRAEIRKMAADTLAQLYKAEPGTRGKIANAAGYGVFSNFGLTILFLGGAGGKGLVHDNAARKDTFMNMGQAQIGIGLGGQKYKAVFIFKDRKTLQNFVEKGWEAGAQAGAAAKAGKSGAADTVGTSVHEGIEIYQLTEAGALLAGTIAGTKYWKDADLN